MANYILHVYGWEMEALAHSLTNEQVASIQELMEENGYNELWECRYDIENEGIIYDLYNPDLFHISKALDNGATWFKVYDENEKNVILEFEPKDMGDYYDLIGDDDVIEEKYPHENYLAIPEYMDSLNNILFVADENKGGVVQLKFESDEIPSPKDFCTLGGTIETPEGDWDFISKYFFKGELLEVYDHLDNSGKASTVQIFKSDGEVIL